MGGIRWEDVLGIGLLSGSWFSTAVGRACRSKPVGISDTVAVGLESNTYPSPSTRGRIRRTRPMVSRRNRRVVETRERTEDRKRREKEGEAFIELEDWQRTFVVILSPYDVHRRGGGGRGSLFLTESRTSFSLSLSLGEGNSVPQKPPQIPAHSPYAEGMFAPMLRFASSH